MPAAISHVYFSAILDGLASNFVTLTAEEKAEDDRQIEAFPTEWFLAVIRRLHFLPDKPCGSSIAHCLQRLSRREFPNEAYEIIGHYAMHDPDPAEDIWRERQVNYYGGDPYLHGINTVRGQAAMAIASLMSADAKRLANLRSAIDSLVRDPVLSVRACAINALTVMLDTDRSEAVALFLACCEGAEPLWATTPFSRFLRIAFRNQYSRLNDLVQRALASTIDKVVENVATEVVLAELGGLDTAGTAERVRRGTVAMRKAASQVYARNLGHDEVGDQAAAHLTEYFEDASDQVRQHVAQAFWGVGGERLLSLEPFIQEFIESQAFENSPEHLLHAMEESRAALPHVVCRAAERLLQFLGEEATSIAHAGAASAYSISKLVVRQYAQAEDPDLKLRCLDLIDRMELVGFLGIGDELHKVDR